jgi:hypothetical protein
MINIDIIKLKQIIDIIFDHITKTRGVTQCELKESLYWYFSEEEIYNMYNNPKELLLGDLYDDLEFLSLVLDPENQPLAYQLTQLAPILRYLGEKLDSELVGQGG